MERRRPGKDSTPEKSDVSVAAEAHGEFKNTQRSTAMPKVQSPAANDANLAYNAGGTLIDSNTYQTMRSGLSRLDDALNTNLSGGFQQMASNYEDAKREGLQSDMNKLAAANPEKAVAEAKTINDVAKGVSKAGTQSNITAEMAQALGLDTLKEFFTAQKIVMSDVSELPSAPKQVVSTAPRAQGGHDGPG